MPTTYAFSARNSRVLLNAQSTATLVTARRWSIGIRVDELDVATFEDLGFTNYEDGLMDADIGMDGFWNVTTSGVRSPDGSATNGVAPPLLYPGVVLNYNYFYVKGRGDGQPNQLGQTGGESSLAFYFPAIKLFTAATDAEVRGTLNISFSAKNQGAFFLPGQAVSANPRNLWK